MRSLTLSATALVVLTATAGAQDFEPAKMVDSTVTRPRVEIGGAFTQSFQALEHENTAAPSSTTTLGLIRPGFNLATANLNVNVALAPGIAVVVENYASSRRHQEFWVKGGYAQLDVSPINLDVLHRVMRYTTMRVGMFEPNYGDAHWRRTDNGMSTRNLFAENLILDSYTTEPGVDLTVRTGPFLGVFGMTSGENKGNIVEDTLINERPAFLAKLGVDTHVGPARVRLTGSTYRASETKGATMFGGDRSGSVYHGVLATATTNSDTKASPTNGRLSPAFGNRLTAYQINPFVQIGGFEFFGVWETARGGPKAQTEDNEVDQISGEAAYRFLGNRLYVAARHNRVTGNLTATLRDVESTRNTFAVGWFVTPGMLLKGEYVTQEYQGWSANHILNGGKFNGFVVQAALTF
jgi:hypothetical protein